MSKPRQKNHSQHLFVPNGICKLDPILDVTVAVSYSPLVGLTGYLLDLDGYV